MIYPEEMTLATRKVFDYMCINASKTNEVIAPQHEMEERLNLSEASINRARTQLFEFDYIRRRASEVYMLNPGVIFKDDGAVRPSIYETYNTLKKYEKKETK